jgi:hypothetical protein
MPDAPIISVEYEVAIGAKVNVETGEVVAVIAWPDDFNTVNPLQFYAGDHPDETLPPELDPEHPLAKQALAIVDRIRVGVGDLHVPFTVVSQETEKGEQR